MKILHIITGLGDGGAEGFLYRLSTISKEDTEQIVISLMDKGKYGDMLIDKGVLVYTLNMNRGKFSIFKIVELYRLIKKIKPDIVETWMYHSDFLGGIVAKLAGVKNIIWTIRHSTHSSHTSLNTRFITKLCALLSYVIPKKIISASQRGVDVHVKLGYKQLLFKHIPNGYNLDLLKPNLNSRLSIRKELSMSNEIPLLGMVGRWDLQKDHYGLLKSLKIIKDSNSVFKCLFVGTNCDISNECLNNQIEELGLKDNIILLGRRSDISSIMNAIDVHILSSSYGEAFPNVVAESMACGTPCIVTDVGDAAYIVGSTGWVVPHSDPLVMSTEIKNALSSLDNSNWNLRCTDARTRVVNLFSIEKVSNTYFNVWNKILNENNEEIYK